MDDVFGKIQSLLSDPESMQQITELAQMLKTETEAAPPAAPASCGETPQDHTSQEADNGLPFDPMLLLKVGEMFSTAQEPDKNTALLLALRPHLREERQQKVDRAIKLLRLLAVWNLLKDSGMLQNLL